MKFLDYLFPFLIGLGFLILVALIAFTPTYADGYCTALGGEKITSSVCNVDGKVVDIR
jgi:hypothetical protein